MVNAAEDFGNSPPDPLLHRALKEWAIAIDAVAAGTQRILLRKGGLQDPRQPFATVPEAAALFPTYEHQVPHHLKDATQGQALSAAPSTLTLYTWARLLYRVELPSEAAIQALMPFHIWNEAFLTERLKWRPQQPLTALVLRAYRLPEAVVLARSPAYSGCRSWIDLDPPIATQGSTPVLSEAADRAQLAAMTAALQREGVHLEPVKAVVE